MSNEIIAIALNKLVPSVKNMRKTGTDAGREELKASLLAHGQQQNIVVCKAGKDKFAVVAGERRRSAFASLAKEKKIPANFPVQCRVCSEEEAAEISLAENMMRLAPHAADQFVAFANLIENGKTTEEVAASFGVTPAVVTRRMKLARVSPTILQAFRDDVLTLDAVMGFTVSEDHVEQDRVFATIRNRSFPARRQDVVRLLTHDKVEISDAAFVYVGEADYLAAGGSIIRDLFSEENEGYAADGALVERLAHAKLMEAVPAHLADGWKWIEPVVSLDWEAKKGFTHISAKSVSKNPEAVVRQEALNARYDEIISQYDGEAPEDGPLAEELERIDAELTALDEADLVYVPEEKALAGGWLTLDHNGRPSLEAGYVRKDDQEALELLRGACGKFGAAGNPEDEQFSSEEDDDMPAPHHQADTSGLSDALLTDLHAARTVALRLELASRSDVALRAVAFSLAGRVLGFGRGALNLSVHRVYVPESSREYCPEEISLERRVALWEKRLPEGNSAALWIEIMELSETDLHDLIAVCAALSLDATYSKHSDASSRQRLHHADQLADALALNMAQYWSPTAEGFFGRVNKAFIGNVVTEAVGEKAASRISTLKKGPMAAEAETLVSGTGWLPTILRTKGINDNLSAAENQAAE